MMKVLVIDDCVDSLQLAKARLKHLEVEILCEQSGQAGLATAQLHMPDLILLDLDMPDMSGFDVCRILKSDAVLVNVPIIFLSSSQDTHDKVKGLDLGAIDYITKPFDPVELQARVRVGLRLKSLQDAQARFASFDPLTELYNRRALDERLREEWSRAERYGSIFSLIIADLDYFKNINDHYGHLVGDQALRQVAQIIVAQCRDSDLAARYGGDEFVMLTPQTNSPDAIELAERVRKNVAASPLLVNGEKISLTVSVGLADSRGQLSTEACVQAADSALYLAKQRGRNRVEFHTISMPSASASQ